MSKIPSRGESIAAVAIVAAAVIGTVAYLSLGVGGVSAAEVKDTALGAMENVDTVKMDMSMTMNVEMQGMSTEVTTHMQGTIDRKDRKMRATMEMPGPIENREYRMYLVENTLYMNIGSMIPENAAALPENFPDWVKVEAQSWKTRSRFGMQKELLERARVKRLKDGKVNGEKCRVLGIEPTDAYWSYMENVMREGGIASGTSPFASSMAPENALKAVENVRDAIENMTMKGWYSKKSGLPLKVRLQMDANMEKLLPKGTQSRMSGTISIEMTMRFHDFDEPVSVELPEGAKGAVPTSALENMMAQPPT